MVPIRLEVEPLEARLEYDRASSFTVTVSNLTDRVEAYQLSVVGLNPRFVDFEPSQLSKVPGRDRSAQSTMTVTIPRSAKVPAHTHVIGVKAQSVVDPGISRVAEVRVDFPAVLDSAVEAVPRLVTAGSRGRFRVRSLNRGTVPLQVQLHGSDEESAVSFSFQPPHMLVPPFGWAESEATVKARRPLAGSPASRALTFRTVDSTGQIQEGSATFVQKPFIRKPLMRFATLAVVAAAAISAFVISRQPVVLEDYSGRPWTEVQEELAGLDVEVTSTDVPHLTEPEGTVLRTIPGPERPVPRGSTVLVEISAGKERFPVPDLPGRSEADARAMLDPFTTVGITVRYIYEGSPDVAKDLVIRTDPPHQGELSAGGSLTVVVSTGVEVPNVVGLLASDAQITLKSAHLTAEPGIPRPTDDEDRHHMVVDQEPPGGTRVSGGDKVLLILWEYEPPPTEPPPPPTEPPPTEPPPTTQR